MAPQSTKPQVMIDLNQSLSNASSVKGLQVNKVLIKPPSKLKTLGMLPFNSVKKSSSTTQLAIRKIISGTSK